MLALEEAVPKHHIGAIIISPTRYVCRFPRFSLLTHCRELATQIHSVLLRLLQFHPPSAATIRDSSPVDAPQGHVEADRAFSSLTLEVSPQLLTGGSSSTPQTSLAHFLRHSPNLLIATPGRLLDLLNSPHVHCSQSSFQALVLDEADRLLSLGFKPTLTSILARLPKQRRTGLFSASVSEAVEELVRVGLRNPYRVNVKVRNLAGDTDLRTPAALRLRYLTVKADRKLPTLLRLASSLSPVPQKIIAYLPTCAAVDYVSHMLPVLTPSFYSSNSLKESKVQIIPLHGRLSQTQRNRNLTTFTALEQHTILLTTDVAARGLDIPLVDLVVQVDPPSDPIQFLHRSGRAGRAGRKGLAVTFLMPGRESDEYPGYLGVRGTPMQPLQQAEGGVTIGDEDAARATECIRKAVLKDRALHDKSQVALPSYVQHYRKHTARSIFRVNELPFVDLTHGWGMLRLPKMPEAKGLDIDRSLGLKLDWVTYAYRDKQREKKRQAEAHNTANGQHPIPANGKRKRDQEAWSKKKVSQDERDMRRDKRERKRVKEKENTMSEPERLQKAELQSLIAQVRAQNAN